MCNITTSTQTHNGKTYTYYSVYLNNKRHLFKTKTEAKAFVATQKAMKEVAGNQLATLVAENQEALLKAIRYLEMHGLPFSSIADAAYWYSAKNQSHAISGTETLGELINQYDTYLEERVAKSTHSAAMQACGMLLSHFGHDFRPVCGLSTERAFKEWADEHLEYDEQGKKRNPVTFNSILRRLNTFANWSGSSGHSITPEMFSFIRRKPVSAKEPRYIKIDELNAFLRAAILAKPKGYSVRGIFAYIALTYYAGIRRCEVLSLKPEDFHYHEKEPFIRVSRAKGASRGRRGRMVPLEPIAAEILRAAYPDDPPTLQDICVFEVLTKRASGMNFYEECGMENYNNIARHSFITYHVAKYGNEQKTVEICGTSKDMAAVHYKGLATKSEAEDYFAAPEQYLSQLRALAVIEPYHAVDA